MRLSPERMLQCVLGAGCPSPTPSPAPAVSLYSSLPHGQRCDAAEAVLNIYCPPEKPLELP